MGFRIPESDAGRAMRKTGGTFLRSEKREDPVAPLAFDELLASEQLPLGLRAPRQCSG